MKGFHFLPMDQRSSELCSVSSTDDEDNKFRILQTNYTEYIIFYLMNVNNNESFQLLELYGTVFSC